MNPRGAGEQERGEGGEAAAPMLRRRRPHLAMQWTFVEVLGCILFVVRGSSPLALHDYNKVYYLHVDVPFQVPPPHLPTVNNLTSVRPR